MSSRWQELILFGFTLSVLLVGFFAETLLGKKVLSPADVLLATASFREVAPPHYEPANRLLMDPVLQFEPWIEFNRQMIRSGRLPLWNSASGCGAPHLANGQAAVFDPFQWLAYLGVLPGALAPTAALRLWFAGIGMFLLARIWNLRGWGRWFAGLSYPLSGFLIVWLLYPVTNAAIWLPWVLWSIQALWDQATIRRCSLLALTVGGTLLGGHVQTAAHVLLAGGAYVVYLVFTNQRLGRPGLLCVAGVMLGVCLAAIEVMPLGAYLARSPVWGDRDDERVAPWRVVRPRIFEMACVVFPSIYGSQRHGEPNLARVVGADNQNESAGSFAGLATLIWLAPLAWGARRSNPRIAFLVGLTLTGFAAAYRLPPVDNLLRIIPVLKVTDNRRLTLWVAFGLVLLGGIGLDQLGSFCSGRSRWWKIWQIVWLSTATSFLAGSLAIHSWASTIQQKALDHYARAALLTPGAEPADYEIRAQRQTEATLRFVPRYLGLCAAEGFCLVVLLTLHTSGRIQTKSTQAILLGLTLAELVQFGFGLNPAISPADDRPVTSLIKELKNRVGQSGRIIGLGAEFPPNSLMRYGLRDPRNYDSVEVQRNLAWFRPIYDPQVHAQTSRREINWERIDQARDRLRVAGVRAVVGPTPPPSSFQDTARYGAVWVAWLDADPLISLAGPGELQHQAGSDGFFEVEVDLRQTTILQIRETFDPGWWAEVDGQRVDVEPDRQTFLQVEVPAGHHQVRLRYDPIEVRIGLILSGFTVIGLVFGLTGSPRFRSTR